LDELLTSFWAVKKLPKQLQLDGTFGEPAITLVRKKNFLIDIYFWVKPDISIHLHRFQGAFTILMGRSLQSHYAFQEKENLKDHVLIGNLSLKKTCLLHPGDVQKIVNGSKFIHQVWHLSFPTVSLVIRNLRNPNQNQYRYLKPHLAISSHFFCHRFSQNRWLPLSYSTTRIIPSKRII